MDSIKLYHGTSERFLDSILKDGIKPRGQKDSNWKCESRSDLVYLSLAYPFYFAINTIIENERLLVLEVDGDKLSSDNFLPDEDFLGQLEGIEKTIEFRDNLEMYSEHWQQSLKGLGNCAYNSIIRPEFITKYVLLDWKQRKHLTMELMDPTISIMNFKFIGSKYIGMVEWFFGYREKLPQVDFNRQLMEQLDDKCMQKAYDFWVEESKNKVGVELCMR